MPHSGERYEICHLPSGGRLPGPVYVGRRGMGMTFGEDERGIICIEVLRDLPAPISDRFISIRRREFARLPPGGHRRNYRCSAGEPEPSAPDSAPPALTSGGDQQKTLLYLTAAARRARWTAKNGRRECQRRAVSREAVTARRVDLPARLGNRAARVWTPVAPPGVSFVPLSGADWPGECRGAGRSVLNSDLSVCGGTAFAHRHLMLL